MLYRILADSVLIVHFAFIVFVMLGGLIVLRWRRAIWLHLPAVAWGVWIMASGNVCPLTPWENTLRKAAGQAGYGGGFIEHYIVSAVYPESLTRSMQFGFAALVIVINAGAYAMILRYFTDDGIGDPASRGNVLVVTKVPRDASEQSCHVAYVNTRAVSNANAVAAHAADTMARDFDCGLHQPVTVMPGEPADMQPR